MYMETAMKTFKQLYSLKMREITSLRVQMCIDESTKKGLKEITIKGYIAKLTTVFNTALNTYNLILKSPIKKFKYKRI